MDRADLSAVPPGNPPESDRLSALEDQLRPGESILWHSIQHPRLIGSNLPVLLFAIPWTAFALFWTGMAWTITRSAPGDDPIATFFPLFGLPFILVGVGMLSLPMLRYLSAKRTMFAVTTERLIRLYKGKGIILESVPPHRIAKVTKKKRKAPHGTLTVKLKGKAADYEPSGKRFIMSDIEHPDIAKRFIKELAAQAKD